MPFFLEILGELVIFKRVDVNCIVPIWISKRAFYKIANFPSSVFALHLSWTGLLNVRFNNLPSVLSQFPAQPRQMDPLIQDFFVKNLIKVGCFPVAVLLSSRTSTYTRIFVIEGYENSKV